MTTTLLREEFSFHVKRQESVPFYFNQCQTFRKPAIFRMDDVEDAFEVLEILSYLVCQETWFATMNCEMIKGKEYYTLYVTYDELSVMRRPGSLYVVTFQQVISFGDGLEYDGKIDLEQMFDVEAIITVTANALELSYENVKQILFDVFANKYRNQFEFFNLLYREILPSVLPPATIPLFIQTLSEVIKLGKAEVHVNDRIQCYIFEKEEYLKQIMYGE